MFIPRVVFPLLLFFPSFLLPPLALSQTTEAANISNLPLVRIGISIPLSGPLAEVGSEIRNGLNLAIEVISKEKDPFRFELIYEDNVHEAKRAVSSAQKLLHVDHVDILITLWDMTDSIAPIAERAKAPLFALRWDPGIAEKFRYTFTFETTYRSYVTAQFSLLKQQSVRRVALITEETIGWTLSRDELAQRAPQEGMTVVSNITFVPGSTDFAAIVTKSIAAKPDIIVIYTNEPNITPMLRRIRELAPHQRFTGYFEHMEDPTLAEGMPFVGCFTVTDWFRHQYFLRYGTQIRSRAAHAYDVMKLIASAYRRTGRVLSGDELVDQIRLITKISGATGELVSSNGGKTFESSPVLLMFHDGQAAPWRRERVS